MIAAFNAVYSALRGFFTQSFWFAAFLPVALVAVLHAAVAIAVLGPIGVLGMTIGFQQVGGDTATAAPLILVGLVVIAYALQPLVPHLTGLLDGSQLPRWLHQWLRPQRLARARETRRALKQALDDMGVLLDLRRNLHDDAGAVPVAYAAAVHRTNSSDRQAAQSAQAALQALRDGLLLEAPLGDKARAAQDAVIAALGVNNPDPAARDAARAAAIAAGGQFADLAPTADAIAGMTSQAADDLEEYINEAAREAIYRHQILRDRNRVVGALDAPRATLIGDARFVAESYAKSVYGVEFGFLWPRLLVAVRADNANDPLLSTIDAARAQVDFAVLSGFLTLTVPAVWLPVILAQRGPVWLFLLIGAATPLAARFFYRLVFEAQLAFGDIAQTAIDRSRFLVMRMLRQAEPLSRGEERRLWARIAHADEDGRSTELLYVPVPAAAAAPAGGAGK